MSAAREIVHYFDYKSPYAYLAQGPTLELARACGAALRLVPYTLDIPAFLGRAEVDAEGRVEPVSNVTGPFEREWIVEGSVMRAVLVGLAAQVASKDKSPVGTIGWRAIAGQDVVAVMFGAARAEQEGPVIGGATSLGVDMVYHVSRSELKVLRKTFAR